MTLFFDETDMSLRAAKEIDMVLNIEALTSHVGGVN